MNYMVKSSFGEFQFKFLGAAKEAALMTGGTLHHILGRYRNGRPVIGKAL